MRAEEEADEGTPSCSVVSRLSTYQKRPASNQKAERGPNHTPEDKVSLQTASAQYAASCRSFQEEDMGFYTVPIIRIS